MTLKSMTPQQQELCLSCLKMAYKWANKYHPVYGEEAESLALYILARCAVKFKPKRKCKFSTYTWACLKKGMQKLKKTWRIGCHQKIIVFTDLTDTLPDMLSREEDPSDLTDSIFDLAAAAHLTPREKEIILLRFKEGLFLHQIAARFNMTKERARQIIKRGVMRLQDDSDIRALTSS